jgi:hypothetical protein
LLPPCAFAPVVLFAPLTGAALTVLALLVAVERWLRDTADPLT